MPVGIWRSYNVASTSIPSNLTLLGKNPMFPAIISGAYPEIFNRGFKFSEWVRTDRVTLSIRTKKV